MPHMRPITRLILFAALGTLHACSSTTAPERDLADAKARWALSNVRSYEYVVSRSCFCTPDALRPVTVSVTDGVVTRRVYADTGALVPATTSDFTTIEALFAVVEGAYARHADRVEASYDPVRGVPLRISIDGSVRIADDEFFITVSSFRAR